MSDTNFPMQPGEGTSGDTPSAAKWLLAGGFVAVVAVVMALGSANGPGGLIGAAEVNVKSMLTDPESAQFKDMKARTDIKVVCGYVNAKNKFGGYVGFRRFYFKEGGQVVVDDGLAYLILHGYERECP
jgi:hypothetical protein